MNAVLLLAQQVRFACGLRWQKHYPDVEKVQAFLFKAVMVIAAITLVLTSKGFADQNEVLEKVVSIYESKVQVMDACENGATGYYYAESGKTFECQRSL